MFSAENQTAIINFLPEDLQEYEMLSKAAEDLRAGRKICYHLTSGAALICGCSDLSMIALI